MVCVLFFVVVLTIASFSGKLYGCGWAVLLWVSGHIMPFMSEITSLDDLNFFAVLADTAGAALVFFTAPSCGACRQLKTVLAKILAEGAAFRAFEVDAVHNGGLVNSLGVFHLPAMFLYLDGHYHRAIHCEPLASRILQAVDQAVFLPAEDEP
jgi:thioredoxin-like negative regulator of GroEL